jgi:hypothetical protein
MQKCESISKGIVGMVAKTMNQHTILASQVEGSKHDLSVDLPATEKTVIHTVPICEGSGCVAVCQFACPEREKSLVGDDGAYHPENTSHFRLLLMLLTFVQKHLYIVNNPRPAANPKSSPRADEDSENRTSSKESRPSSKDGERPKSKKRDADGPTQEEEEAAIKKIQAIARGRADRAKAKQLSAAKRDKEKPSSPAATRSGTRRETNTGGLKKTACPK